MKAMKAALALALMALKAPLYAAYGIFFLVARWFGLMGRAGSAARLLAAAVPCPSCRASNPLSGRWRCRGCGATYHGAVFHCPLCGSGASWVACRACGASIPLARRR